MEFAGPGGVVGRRPRCAFLGIVWHEVIYGDNRNSGDIETFRSGAG